MGKIALLLTLLLCSCVPTTRTATATETLTLQGGVLVVSMGAPIDHLELGVKGEVTCLPVAVCERLDKGFVLVTVAPGEHPARLELARVKKPPSGPVEAFGFVSVLGARESVDVELGR